VILTPGIKAFALSVTVPLNVALDWLNNSVHVARQTTATTILNTVLIAIAPVLNVCVCFLGCWKIRPNQIPT
jgi:hypothetical protein